MTSRSGSADVLDALGVRIDHDAASAGAALRDLGFAFLFAANFHPAMRYAGPTRRSQNNGLEKARIRKPRLKDTRIFSGSTAGLDSGFTAEVKIGKHGRGSHSFALEAGNPYGPLLSLAFLQRQWAGDYGSPFSPFQTDERKSKRLLSSLPQ